MGKNKRPKSYYIQSAKRQKHTSLGADMVGFMCTCNYNERDCVREAYNILNEFADGLYGKEFPDSEECGSQSEKVDGAGVATSIDDNVKSLNKSENITSTSAVSDDEDDDEPLDIEAAIKADVSELTKNSQVDKKRARRFHQVQCGAQNCVFIQTTLEDPLPVSLAIMDDLLLSQKQRTKKLLRMIPVQVTCKAYPEDIKKAVEKLSLTYFKESSKTFCIVFKVRNNSSVKKENMVFELANILQNANKKNSPDFNEPDVVVNINVIKNVCCLSFLPDYFTKYCKYNLVLLANKNKSLQPEDSVVKEERVSHESNAEKGDKVTMEISEDKDEKVKSETNDEKVKSETNDEKVKSETNDDNDEKVKSETNDNNDELVMSETNVDKDEVMSETNVDKDEKALSKTNDDKDEKGMSKASDDKDEKVMSESSIDE